MKQSKKKQSLKVPSIEDFGCIYSAPENPGLVDAVNVAKEFIKAFGNIENREATITYDNLRYLRMLNNNLDDEFENFGGVLLESVDDGIRSANEQIERYYKKRSGIKNS